RRWRAFPWPAGPSRLPRLTPGSHLRTIERRHPVALRCRAKRGREGPRRAALSQPAIPRQGRRMTPLDSSPDTAAPGWRAIATRRYGPALALVCLGVWLHAADSLLVATMLPAMVGEIGGQALVA